jgi:hypothetical protein
MIEGEINLKTNKWQKANFFKHSIYTDTQTFIFIFLFWNLSRFWIFVIFFWKKTELGFYIPLPGSSQGDFMYIVFTEIQSSLVIIILVGFLHLHIYEVQQWFPIFL